MSSNPKPKDSAPNPVSAPDAAPVADVGAVSAATSGVAHASPARALQDRLVRELTRPSQPWLWHSAGLVLTLILSLWVVGLTLDAGV